MAQRKWTVPRLNSHPYSVGLYHGSSSGHVVVYVNGKITIIDFGVKEDKSYSFFLDEELYELKISKNGSAYDYELLHDENIASPLNQIRQDNRKWERWRIGIAATVLAIVILVIGSVVYFRQAKQNNHLAQHFTDHSVTTTGRLFKQNDQWYINYLANDVVVSMPLPPTDTLYPLGFPLVEGDDLTVRYLPNRSTRHEIDWAAQPTQRQLERYRKLVAQLHQALHPELNAQQVSCQLAAAEARAALVGLATFYHQDGEFSTTLNRDAYLRFVREPNFAEQLRNCL